MRRALFRCSPGIRRAVSMVTLAASATLGAWAATAAPAAQEPPFESSTRLVAVDIPMRLERESPTLGRKPVEEWDVGDFQVVVEGQPVPVVALQAAGELDLTVWLDRVLSDDRTLRLGAEALARHAEELVAAGPVEVVVGEATPRRILGATRDAELLASTLLAVAREPEGMDAQRRLREAFLAEGGEGWEALEVIHGGAALDELSLWLARPPRREGIGRALVLVSQGLDLAPEAFYSPAKTVGDAMATTAAADRRPALSSAHPPGRPDSRPDRPPLNELVTLQGRARALGRVAAGYGWATVVVHPPAPASDRRLKPGWRLGKVRIFYGLKYEEERDPERAQAYLDLAAAKEASGDWEEARDDLGRALHHFYGDPRTAAVQAQALERLAVVLEELGDDEGARRAREEAEVLVMAAETDHDGSDAPWGEIPGQPRRALEELVEATGGQWVEGGVATHRVPATDGRVTEALAREVGEALEGLGQTRQLTVQLANPVPGSWLSARVSTERSGHRVNAPVWLRSGTPPAVVEAQLLTLLAAVERGDGGELGAKEKLRVRWRQGRWEVRWSGPEAEAPPRLVAIAAGSGVAPRRLSAAPQRAEDGAWQWSLAAATADGPWLAVAVDVPENPEVGLTQQLQRRGEE